MRQKKYLALAFILSAVISSASFGSSTITTAANETLIPTETTDETEKEMTKADDLPLLPASDQKSPSGN